MEIWNRLLCKYAVSSDHAEPTAGAAAMGIAAIQSQTDRAAQTGTYLKEETL